ncbi:c-type cytochrome [Mucilaginibacter sp. UR6-11]|uniref:c-type cytochrome n=1 Tax=Mucilaginibacter sp. UR6-11 TaxID=1435644 RepID=UPI001E42A597|nr:c-type cytochrome [Mucilaginibacter sp. UR6-11]MCC8423466.1 c-type cytochrome [Mucilaginibacter sp. UR6-11]
MMRQSLFIIVILTGGLITVQSLSQAPSPKITAEILYGKDLIVRTAYYLGPNGKVAHLTNGMNCQNCHNDAGTKFYGLNLIATAANYPQYMPRTGNVMSVAGRINGCLQRSLNGKPLDTTSREMKAMVAYIRWLGKNVPKGQKPAGSSVLKLAYMQRAASPLKGETVFMQKCQACHGANGQGLVSADKIAYIYPPLWGPNSYNDGAGLYRIITFAAFVKSNMPFGTTYKKPQLSDEEAWNVAAFVNSQPRPHFDQHQDWKDQRRKPVDFPFGPYADKFSEQQHKFGPYKPIADLQKSIIKKT